jgi:hypothetical protein
VESPSLSRIFGPFTEVIKSELKSLCSFRVIHVKREVNFDAYVLAKASVFHVRDSIWLKETPP